MKVMIYDRYRCRRLPVYRGVIAAYQPAPEHLPRRTSGPPDAARNILLCSLVPLSEYSPTGQRLIIRHDCPLENGESRAPRLQNNEVSLLEPHFLFKLEIVLRKKRCVWQTLTVAGFTAVSISCCALLSLPVHRSRLVCALDQQWKIKPLVEIF